MSFYWPSVVVQEIVAPLHKAVLGSHLERHREFQDKDASSLPCQRDVSGDVS